MAYTVQSTQIEMETARYLETLDSLCTNGVLLNASARARENYKRARGDGAQSEK